MILVTNGNLSSLSTPLVSTDIVYYAEHMNHLFMRFQKYTQFLMLSISSLTLFSMDPIFGPKK